MLSSVVLGAAMALTAAVSLAATALIVPGTGTPNANIVDLYRQHATDRYIAPFNPSCTSTTCTMTGIDYPASFFPLGFIGNWCPGYSCDTWNASVGTGVDNTITALQNLTDPDGAILFGYSQGGAVVSDTLRSLEGNPLMDKVKSVVMIGNAYNPDGGIFTRLGFLPTIPFLDITFGPPMPTDTGIPITSIGFQYDPVMYAPLYWGNPFSMLNALAAFETVHGFYLTPNGNGPTDPIAYGYTEPELAEQLDRSLHPENFREDSHGNVYVTIPAKSLPIADLVLSTVPASLTPIVKPFVDLVSPAFKVLADLGYDFSGDPGVPRTLSILPFNPIQNWPAVGVKLVAAAIQGIQAFIGDLGALTTIAPATVAPPSNTPVSTLAAARTTETTETTEPIKKVSETKLSTSRLTLVKDSETTVQQTTVENDGTSALADEKPVTKPEETPVTKPEDATKPVSAADEKKSDDKKADVQKDATDKKDANDKKTDTDKKIDTHKTADTDQKDADSAKAAA
jgi:pimeloyl-ACP methyl ester carboxylesterase